MPNVLRRDREIAQQELLSLTPVLSNPRSSTDEKRVARVVNSEVDIERMQHNRRLRSFVVVE
jgi:hypothetical protein